MYGYNIWDKYFKDIDYILINIYTNNEVRPTF